MVRVSSPAKLRPWSELTAKLVMGVVPGLVKLQPHRGWLQAFRGKLEHRSGQQSKHDLGGNAIASMPQSQSRDLIAHADRLTEEL